MSFAGFSSSLASFTLCYKCMDIAKSRRPPESCLKDFRNRFVGGKMSCIVRFMTLVYNIRNFSFRYSSSVYPIRAMPVEVWFIPMISSNFSEEFLPHIPLEFLRLDLGFQIVYYISIPGSIFRVPTNCVHLSLRFFIRCEIYLITSNVNLYVNIYFIDEVP